MESPWQLLHTDIHVDVPISETFAMEIKDVGCVVRVHTRDDNGYIAESLTFVPWTKLGDREEEGIVVGRKLIGFQKF